MLRSNFIKNLRVFVCALFLCAVQFALAQTKVNVTGTVVDTFGDPVIGANVIEEGTTNGSVTNADGMYSLSVKPNATLKVSFIGYKATTIKVTKAGTYNATLEEDSDILEETIVVGYGVVRKADLAGSVSVMSAKNFEAQPITEVSDALQGRMAGVQVEPSGVPGGSVKIRVRGANSVNKSNEPLYVVDGIVRESGLEGLNSEDIASIQVLKDASSTAIYGSRGSNGVVLVTTKTGRADQTLITFDAQVGVSSLAKKLDLMNAEEYANAYMDIKGNPNAFTSEELASYKNGGGIDWQDQMFRNAITQNYKVAISKGNKNTQYYISGNYMDQQGIFVYNGAKRYTGRANITSDVTSWLHATADVNVSHVDRKGGQGFGASKDNPIWQVVSYSPTMTMYAEDGSYNFDNYNSIQRNPYGKAKEEGSDYNIDIVNAMVDLRFTILPGLTFTTTNGMDYRDFKYYYFNTTRVEQQNSMGNSDTMRRQLQSSNNLTYTNKWGKHNLTATGVFEVTKNQTRTMSISGKNLQTESVGYWNIGLASSRDQSNGYSEWALMSGVGRVLYNYDNRYMATLTFRADGSSKFTNEKWGYFPSAALAWNLSNEQFMKSQEVVSNAKVRVSYGIVGSQALDAYETLGMLSAANYGYGGSTNYPGYWAYSLATPDLTWEKTKQFDLGVDFSILDGKVDISLDYYSKKTEDALLKKTIPNYDGGGSYWVNAGQIDNKGFEFAITARPIQTDNFNWSSTLTGTFSKNEVVDLAGDEFVDGATPAAGLIGDGVTRAAVGHPIGVFYLYDWQGIDPQTGANIYADTNKDGKVDSADRIYIGKATPTCTFGWNNTFTYKNWDLNIFFNSSFGAKRLNIVRFAAANQVGDSRFITLKDAYTNSWDNNKENPKYATQKGTTQSYPNSTQYLEDANYVRLQNLAISYNLAKKYAKIADIKLSLSCQNLFTISGYSGYDPAGYAVSSGHSDVNSGIDMGGYPTPRTITFGAKFNF